MTKKLFPFGFLVACLFFFLPSVYADDPPSWLLEASKLPTPTFKIKNVPAVVLKNEENITVNSDGALTSTKRFAVRVLVHEGREEAIASSVYATDSEKVRDIKAWLLRSTGPNKNYGKKEIVDVARVGDDLYNEARVKFIDATNEADTGDVFGYETVTETRNVFSQTEFYFQKDLPVISASFSLNLPIGWKADSITFNREKVEPSLSGTSYNWTLRDLQPINKEPSSPSWTSLCPRLAVSYYPPQSTASINTFANWNAVAKWMSELEDPQMTVDDAMATKVIELTANAKTELEKIQAIARYVQKIQYISIQIGTGRGGGYRPHTATEVFAKSYGDCKDKANLMRAMLSVVKIQSYMVSITATDSTYVRAEWSSPHQFNHCIIAIKIGDETKVPSVVTHPKLGRLLIFDATASNTQVGDLPEEEQGSLALIDHKDTDTLLEMPIMPPEMSRLERNIEVALSTEGAISGIVKEKSAGQTASQERARLRGLSAPDYNKMIERWISRGVAGAKTTKITPLDGEQNGNFNLEVEFGANNYAQLNQGRLMVFKPAVIGRLDRLSFNEGNRQHPYLIDSEFYEETVKIKLPMGFIVDEIPESTKLETNFGKYSATYLEKDGYLLFKRSLTLNRTSVPAEKYGTVRDFFGTIHSAEQSPVVLLKK